MFDFQRKSVGDRLDEVLDNNTFADVMNPKNYLDPTEWMKEHVKTHPEFLTQKASAVLHLPFTFEVSECGIGYAGRCRCNICNAEHSMTDRDNW